MTRPGPMVVSRAIPTVLRLHTLFTEALATSPFAGEVDAYLGPMMSGDPDDSVHVGYDGDPMGDMEMVVHQQQWVGIGAGPARRDEEFDVRCCILNMSGSTDAVGFAAAIARLYSIARVLFAPIHRDPSLGLGPGTEENAPRFTADVRGFSSYVPTDDQRGVMPRVQFSVHVVTRV
jgi:hypothetical protein